MSESWRTVVEREASNGEPAHPMWSRGVPYCDDACRHHDGKRCRLLGLRLGAVCEPVVEAMGSALESAAKGAGR